MAIGSFSNGGLGMGVAFSLEDNFSKTASTIEARMDSLSGNTEEMASKIDKSMSQIRLGMSALAAGAAILSPFVLGLNNASDLEENINKTKVAFGDYANDVLTFAKSSLSSFGVSENQALDAASLFGDMGTSMGVTQEEAARLATSLVGLGGDLSSFKNISQEQAAGALKGIFTGETESLKGLGVVMNETTLASFAQAQGITKTVESMTQAEKVMLRYQFVMDATKNAQGDFARTSEGFANSQRTLQGTLEELSASLGAIFMPIVAKAMGMLTGFLGVFKAFADSPLGQGILTVVGAMGALLAIGGLVLVMVGSLRFAVYGLAGAFSESTKAKIIDTLVTQGLTAGLRMMAVQAWATIAPFAVMAIKFTAVALVVKGAFDLMSSAFNSFDEMGEGGVMTGVFGFFQKVAGVIRGVAAIWSSWTGETFSLTEEMASKLESLGILDFVLAIGTWAVRIKEFFSSVWLGMVEGFNLVSSVFFGVVSFLGSLLTPISNLFDMIGFSMEKNTSQLETWRTVGKAVGAAIIAVLTAMAIQAVISAATMIAAFFPIIAVITLIVGAVLGVIWVVQHFGEVVQFVASMVVMAWEWVTQKIFDFFDFMMSLPSLMYEAGVAFVLNLWNGIKAMWSNMVAWLTEKINALVDGIKGVFSFVTGSVDVVAQETENNTKGEVTGAGTQATPLATGSDASHHATTSKNPAMTLPATNVNNQVTTGPTNVQFILDGDLIADKMIEKQELKESRK